MAVSPGIIAIISVVGVILTFILIYWLVHKYRHKVVTLPPVPAPRAPPMGHLDPWVYEAEPFVENYYRLPTAYEQSSGTDVVPSLIGTGGARTSTTQAYETRRNISARRWGTHNWKDLAQAGFNAASGTGAQKNDYAQAQRYQIPF